ncbi:MAG: hypothetical protein ACQESC_02135 [Nanobdellota archaeon]
MMNKKKQYKNKIHRKAVEAGLGFWIFIFLMIIIGSFFIFNVEQTAKNMVLQHGIIGVFLFAILTDLLILPVGADVPLILALLLPDLQNSTVLLFVLTASYISLTIAYFIGKKVGAKGINILLSKKAAKKITKMRSLKKYERGWMFLSSLTPLPYIPYLSGVFGFNFKEIITYIVIPRTLRYLIVFTLTLTLGTEILGLI